MVKDFKLCYSKLETFLQKCLATQQEQKAMCVPCGEAGNKYLTICANF